MNEEQLKQLERILKENISISQHGYMNGLADLEGIEDAAKAIAALLEEEKRKAFYAAREYNIRYTLEDDPRMFVTYEDYLKSTTQSTESGNLNTK